MDLPVIEMRNLGDRCCDRGAKSTLGARAARQLADDLGVLAHPIRLQLLDVLVRNAGKVCVCDLEAAVPVKQPTVSHHLRLLRQAGLVNSERRGLWAYYFVKRDAVERLRSRLTAGLSGMG
jgi:ArsR family transcriptional regulator